MLNHRKPTHAGFTLVELLVVILIISILLTIGSVALRDAGGKGVTTALATTEALFDEARSIAVGKGARARILIDADDSQDETYLRRIVIVSEVLDEEGRPQDPPVWELSSRGYTLPEKVYFSQQFSRKDHEGGSGEIPRLSAEGGGALDANGSLYDGDYYFYEFNGEGICTTGLGGSGAEATYSGPSFVVGSGARALGESEPRTTSEGRRDFAGFVIWRNGSTSIFRDPGQIIGSGDPRNF